MKLLKILFNIFKGICRVIGFLAVIIVIQVIKLVTYEPGKSKEITVRKARRIRALSKFKLFVFNVTPEPVLKFFGKLSYKDYLNKHLRNGLQLRYQ